MKKLVLFCFAAVFCVMASAQKVYFLYLQSDDQSPFYVKMGDKIYSSAASGFLILPNLVDSSYNFGIGFAKSTVAESRFSVSINQSDKGFLIKNFNDGLALFDLLELSLVKANSIQQDNTVYETKADKFSSILSKAADDPGLLKVPVAKKEEPAKPKPLEKEVITAKVDEQKLTEQQPAIDSVVKRPSVETAKQDIPKKVSPAIDTTVVTSAVQKEVKQTTVEPVPQQQKRDLAEETLLTFRRSTVSRYTESSTTEGFGVVYIDKKEEAVDTIRILIPPSKIKLAAENEPMAKETIVVPSNANNPAETKNTDAGSSGTTVSTQPINTAICKKLASDKDFLKLRKKMAAKENNDAMLDEARKEFKAKCYTVEQVRYLSTLFLTSAAKYQFFDAAYNAVSDKGNFSSLGIEIKDDHYAKRFKALVGE
jgi:hypothetical protein